MKTQTTLEALVAAAISTDAETLGNNSGASYTNRFVFDGKYAFEAYCTNDKNIWITLCHNVSKESSDVYIGHCLRIMHNPQLAPIYAQFLWADFESTLYNYDNKDIDKEDFAIALLNCREDELGDRARDTICEVFASTTEYEKRDGYHYFMSKFGPVYLNDDCFDYYIDAIGSLPDDILAEVRKNHRVAYAADVKHLSRLTGVTLYDVHNSADRARLKLLDMVLNSVDPEGFSWVLNADRAIKEAKSKRLAEVKELNANTAEAYKECLKHFQDAKIQVELYGSVSLAEDIYDWQTAESVSFDFQTLALLFHELGIYEAEFADELLRDTYICEVLSLAYVKPSSYVVDLATI